MTQIPTGERFRLVFGGGRTAHLPKDQIMEQVQTPSPRNPAELTDLTITFADGDICTYEEVTQSMIDSFNAMFELLQALRSRASP